MIFVFCLFPQKGYAGNFVLFLVILIQPRVAWEEVRTLCEEPVQSVLPMGLSLRNCLEY